MKYAHYDESNGRLLGWYDDGIHDTIPTPNIEVTDTDWGWANFYNYNFVDNVNNTLSKKEFRTEEEIFTQAKNEKVSEIASAFNRDVETITTARTHEMVSWRKQEEEARAYMADNANATPFIDAQLVTRDLGETKDELVSKIIANADAYQVAYATLLGKFQNLSNAIAISTTVSELDLIKW